MFPKAGKLPINRTQKGRMLLRGSDDTSRWRACSLRDADAQAAEALALALDLDDLDPADLAGRGDVGAAVRLLVQAYDVDDPDLLDLRRHEVGRGPDDVGQGERLVPGQHP